MPKCNLAGRTVVITGSTGGLGTALAQALRDRGANLALLDLNQESVDTQAAKLGPETVVRGWTADVGDLTALERAMRAAAKHFGRVDIVIANAGIAPPAPKALSVTARIPGIIRPFVDRFGFPRTTISHAIALAKKNQK